MLGTLGSARTKIRFFPTIRSTTIELYTGTPIAGSEGRWWGLARQGRGRPAAGGESGRGVGAQGEAPR